MKTNDYVKYLTQTVVKYADQPKEERLKNKQERKAEKSSFLFRWFGILPFVLMSMINRKR
ncbi:YqzE family protein [Mesobacillus foraminis]|jgi:nitrate reductase NapE component|uniref:YqzE family protein n=1 Tax=Mesobacillus foraminis TaxID=279826 RepID=UPI000EF4BDCA|nr:YqzE family protein [Mesobacillus foraminis]MBT2754755.1 YqzE family protein [Mesobacillus foraminis]